MSFLLINIVLAVVPSFLLLLYFYRRDRQKQEPLSLIWKIFAIGCLAVIPAGIIELLLNTFSSIFSGLLLRIIRAFFIAACVEETLKLSVVRLFAYNRTAFDEITDGIIYTISAGLGFALFENLLYSFGPPLVLIIRGLSAVPLHAIASGIMGYYIGVSKFDDRTRIRQGLLYAILIHGLYDFFLFTGSAVSFLVIPLLFVGWLILRRLINNALRMDRERGLSTS